MHSIKEYLDNLENARETLIKRGRDVINLARAVITNTILGKNDEDSINKLRQIFIKLYNDIKMYPELIYSNIFYSIATEYVEAIQLYSITTQYKLIPYEELNIHPVPYLLGLAEIIGELKRISLEFIRKDRFEDAHKLLEIGEKIYSILSTFSYPDAILPGFRHKLDIYRRVIDEWKKFLLDIESRKTLIYKLDIILRYNESQNILG